jgi:two-component system NtrC family sensor kinase
MSLQFKMILGIGGILILVIVVYGAIASKRQTDHLRAMGRREAELIAATAERAMALAMIEGKTEEVQHILEEIGKSPDISGIRIVSPQGAIFHSGNPEEIGRSLGELDLPEDGTSPKPVWDVHAQTVGIFRPILNGPQCLPCHSQDQAVLGYLNTQVVLPSIDSETIQHWTFMIILSIAALLAAGAMIAIYFMLVVSRRVEVLSRSMSQLEAGDLTARVRDEDRDELGRLAKSFNTMVARLAAGQQRLEDRHAQEIQRAEHLASLGKMAAGIAHEINNPLAGMQNCIRTLLKGTSEAGKRVQYLTMLKDGLDRIGRIVGHLGDFSRAPEPQFIWTDLDSVLGQTLTLLEHELTARQISPALPTGSRLPALRADPHQLEQVFLNILMNALEAMPSSGNLTITSGTKQREAGLFIEVRITDTGIGIPPEHLPRIFDPFFTTKEVGKGTGLGLSVSYGIVKAHGGFVDIESEVGKGTTITVALPVGSEGGSDGPPAPLGER